MNEILKLDFLTDLNYYRIVFDLILLFILSKIIEACYNRYAYSSDNKLLFTRNMFNFLIAIFLIVTVIKSSIALSLGLVGALSIIRFRTAIKEPGQLINLLILTATAIAMAAEKEVLAIIIVLIYSLNTFLSHSKDENQLITSKILRISIENNELSIKELMDHKGFRRIYKDVNNISHIEYEFSSKTEDISELLENLKSRLKVISYEVI